MNITHELREWAHGFNGPWKRNEEMLTAIADRIDAEHEKATSEFWTKINAVPVTDENMAERGWIRLPKDADGEVWHVGDLAVGEVNPNNPKAVERMLWYGPDSGWQLETDTIIFPCPDRPRHYHAPTVEDVLRQVIACANNGTHVHGALDTEQIVAEYAAKLQLREDA